MALRDRIRQSLSASGPMDDDELAGRLGVVRQQVNQRARQMEKRGELRRYLGTGGKIVNELLSTDHSDFDSATSEPASVDQASRTGGQGNPDVLLVTCVKNKAAEPSAAKDLYRSVLFSKQRAYAERLGVPWFILSAEHGLVGPEEWLAPYERYLPDTPSSYRAAWGRWVVERLKLLAGDLRGRTVEVHASEDYVTALRGHLEAAGATIAEPLRGLTQGKRLNWYGLSPADEHEATVARPADVEHLVRALTDVTRRIRLPALIERGSEGLKVPGLYSWWIDEDGCAEVSAGLGHSVSPGLIYAGLAGATRWPSGLASANTLWSRITTMHLGRRHTASTLRLTLGSVLAAARGWPSIDEPQLTAWMLEHLSVVLVPYTDADSLGQMEGAVLAELEPPLNLQSRPSTPVRARLTELRRVYSAKR